MTQTPAVETTKRAIVCPRPIESKAFGFETRRGNSGNIDIVTFAGWASTEDEDLYEDVVRASGWAKDLPAFKKNPIMLYLHSARYLIGGFPSVKVVKDQGLWVNRGEVVVSKFVEEFILPYLETEYLRAMSVGFMPIESKPRDPEDDSWWAPREFTRQRLLEISLVPMPANPEALIDLSKALTAHGMESLQDPDTPNLEEVLRAMEAGRERTAAEWFSPIERAPQFSCPECVTDLYKTCGLSFDVVTEAADEVAPEGDGPEDASGTEEVNEAAAPDQEDTVEAAGMYTVENIMDAAKAQGLHAHPGEHLADLDPEDLDTYAAAHLVGPRDGEDPAKAGSHRLALCGMDHDTLALDPNLVQLAAARVLSHRDGLLDQERAPALATLAVAYTVCGLEWPTDQDGQPVDHTTPYKAVEWANGEDESLRQWVALSTLRGLRDGLRGLARTNWQAPETAREDVEEVRALLAACLPDDLEDKGTNPATSEALGGDTPDPEVQTFAAFLAAGLTEDQALDLKGNLEEAGTNLSTLGPVVGALVARALAMELQTQTEEA